MRLMHNNQPAKRPALVVLALAAMALAAPQSGGTNAGVPLGLLPAPFPADNPANAAKVALGERLFFETGLSADRSVSCGTCHKPERAFADFTPLSKGVRAQTGERNTPTLLNVAYLPHLLWDGRSPSLEDQARYPLTHPREMNNTTDNVVQFLSANPEYPPLFQQAFGDDKISWERAAKAIASFERTLLAGNSPFDRYMAGSSEAIQIGRAHV